MNMNRYWVGEREGSNILWVFDRNVIHSDQSMVYLYNSKNKVLEAHPKDFARSVLRTVKDERAKGLISEFKSWFSLYGENFLIQDQLKETDNWYAAKKIELSYVENRHRAPNCYACGNTLDSKYNKRCLSCGWLICTCGSCGCNYTKQKPN